jgi:hypothetical protein
MGWAMSVTEWATLGSLVFNVLLVILGLKVKAEVGEMQARMQEKIREIELYTRDNFVRSDLFDKFVSLLSSNMEVRIKDIQTSIDRLGDKFDRLSRPEVG